MQHNKVESHDFDLHMSVVYSGGYCRRKVVTNIQSHLKFELNLTN